MAVVSMKQLLEAGVHFGHQTRRWNPKMAKYIFTERNGIYIIDLQKTVKKLDEAYNFVRDTAAQGGEILFVGTKKQAQESIRDEATRCGMHYVNARWLGGMMTNFRTIRKRIDRMEQLKTMQEDGTFDLLPKKEVVKLELEMAKLDKYLGGVKNMKALPKAMFIVDPHKERIAVSEARKLNIPIVAIVDTKMCIRDRWMAMPPASRPQTLTSRAPQPSASSTALSPRLRWPRRLFRFPLVLSANTFAILQRSVTEISEISNFSGLLMLSHLQIGRAHV